MIKTGFTLHSSRTSKISYGFEVWGNSIHQKFWLLIQIHQMLELDQLLWELDKLFQNNISLRQNWSVQRVWAFALVVMNIALFDSIGMDNHTRKTKYSTVHFYKVGIGGKDEDEGENAYHPTWMLRKLSTLYRALDPPVNHKQVKWTMCIKQLVRPSD